jgi:2-phosphoglycerate kinase
MYIPKDAILILSGVSCVGKTTTAYEILKNYPEFRRVSEYDLIRAVVRTSYENLLKEVYTDADELKKQYDALFASITNSNFDITKLQSEQLVPYVKEIILRQQRRRIPTIIEGTGIVPSTYFPNNQPLEWLTKHVVFVNLYLSDENEHVFRRQSRSIERDYHESISKTKTIVLQSRAEKNQLLHMQATELHQVFKNVISIDISNCTPNCVADKIMEFVFEYFNANNS